jgi:diguanylate cyclase (GGDEF)-like protein
VLASFNRGRNSGESDLSFGTSSVSKPVIYAGETLGTVDVQVDSSIVATVPTFFVLACVGIISLLLLAVWLLAKPVERWITRPIGALSMFTRRIRDTQNYALRVPQSKAKELHGFVDDFNAMLGEIEKTSQAQSKQSSQLSKLAYFDPLTGAANRTLFRDRLTACVDTHRREHIPFAIIGIDLDYFKQLNDSLGHNVGDDYLRAASNRCLAQLGPECTFARMGGDEFLVLLPGVGTVREARPIAEKLGQALREANAIHNSNVQCSGSIGIGLFPFDAANPSELMSKVDAAMYRAKANGRNCVETVSVDDEPEIAPRPQPSAKSFLSTLQDAS